MYYIGNHCEFVLFSTIKYNATLNYLLDLNLSDQKLRRVILLLIIARLFMNSFVFISCKILLLYFILVTCNAFDVVFICLKIFNFI